MYVVQNKRLEGFGNLSKMDKIKVVSILVVNYVVLAGYVIGVSYVLLRLNRNNVPRWIIDGFHRPTNND